MPGSLNHGANMLSRGDVAPGEWTLHPQRLQEIWSVFWRAEVDLFASITTLSAQLTSRYSGTLWPDWPSARLYAFPLIALLPQVINRSVSAHSTALLDVFPMHNMRERSKGNAPVTHVTSVP